jgi:phage shock protein PspC (stress-responsive transcriptional regulator)
MVAAPPSRHSGHMTKSKQPPTHGHGIDGFYAALRRPGVVRVSSGRWFAGVATGIARWLGVDPLVVRAAFILFSIFFGMGVAFYLVLWLLMPDERGEIHLERALKYGEGGSIFLLVVTVLSVLGGGPWWGNDLNGLRFGGFVLLAVGTWYFLTRTRPGRELIGWPWKGGSGGAAAGSSDTPASPGSYQSYSAPSGPSTGNAAANAGVAMPGAPTEGRPAQGQPAQGQVATYAPPRPRVRTRSIGFAAGLLVLGAAVVTGALVSELARAQSWDGNPIAVGLAAGLGVLGLGIVGAGLAGRRAGGLAFVAVVGIFATLFASAAPRGLTQPWQVGQQTHVVTNVATAPDFQLGLGEMKVDLTNADLSGAQPATVRATVGMGRIDLVVPEGVRVTVHATARAGALTAVGTSNGDVNVNSDTGGNPGVTGNGGIGVNETVSYGPQTGPVQLAVEAEVGLGEVHVTTGSPS